MPALIDVLCPGKDSYVTPAMMPATGTPAISRAWKYQQVLRSVQWGSGGVVKNRSSFVDHIKPSDLAALLDEAESAGVKRPSSYADLFHHCYSSPRLSGPVARAVQHFDVFGGWQQLTKPTGDYAGTWRRYDIRSAYLWAMTEGLPHPRSMRFSERIGRHAGVYVAEVLPQLAAPPPFRRGGRVIVTPEEIERYNLTVTKLDYGIEWTYNVAVDPMLAAVMRWSCWKQVGRSFWGRWGSNGKVNCVTFRGGEQSKAWELPNNTFNPIWAHLITSRIKARLYDVLRGHDTARVYVDSVVTTAELPTGNNIGDWKLEAEYSGLAVRHLNRYYSLAS